jgi:hypothetical protein
MPVSLRSSGPRKFSTVLELPTFRRTYLFQRKEVLRPLSDRRERLISNSPYRGSNPPPQPGILSFREFTSLDEKGPLYAGFSYREKSLETDVQTFGVENKSPAESKKTPVFWRLCPADKTINPLRGRCCSASPSAQAKLDGDADEIAEPDSERLNGGRRLDSIRSAGSPQLPYSHISL